MVGSQHVAPTHARPVATDGGGTVATRAGEARPRAASCCGGMGYRLEVLGRDDELEALEPEWSELFSRSGSRNPFAHPAWMIPWLRHNVPDERKRVVLAARAAGELVAVAPFHRLDYPLGARVLHLAGASPLKTDRLTESSEILVAARDRRRIVRALLHHLANDVGGFDWLALTLTARQGWFESDWLPEQWRRRGGFVVHRATRPSVILPLPSRWEELPLKRNLREALRRSRNRLRSEAAASEIRFAGGAELVPALETLVQLHRRRAADTTHLRHDDYFRDDAVRGLLDDAATRWALGDDAVVAQLLLDGRPIAARLVLRANDAHFLSFSGSDVDHWRLGAATTLVAAAIRRAIADEAAVVNFSASPDSAKLRWSEQLELEQEFVAVAPARMSRARFGLWWHARARNAVTTGRRLVEDQLPAR